MRQLESVEQYLVEQLGKTQNTQQKALENLHSVVQLCNQKLEAPQTGARSMQGGSIRNPSYTTIGGPPSRLNNKNSVRSFTQKGRPLPLEQA